MFTFIKNPNHCTFICIPVGCGDILIWAYEISYFTDITSCKLSGLIPAQFLLMNHNTAPCVSKGDVHYSTFQRLKKCEVAQLFDRQPGMKPYASFRRPLASLNCTRWPTNILVIPLSSLMGKCTANTLLGTPGISSSAPVKSSSVYILAGSVTHKWQRFFSSICILSWFLAILYEPYGTAIIYRSYIMWTFILDDDAICFFV